MMGDRFAPCVCGRPYASHVTATSGVRRQPPPGDPGLHCEGYRVAEWVAMGIAQPAPPPQGAPAQPDAVNHPKHYNSHPAGIECITVVEHFPFNVGNAIKYCWRVGLQDGADPIEDLRRAQWYIEREIARLSKDGK